jgi:hypothetical protein
MAKNKKRTPRYSNAEKHAYYVGMGVGLTANGYGTGLTQRAFRMMSDKEKKSYISGYEKGNNHPVIQSGIKSNKRGLF